jgi:DNA-binding transcriptional LysR family regulator
MDVNQLEVLVAVANEKSFSRAAELLKRTQPAVSQAVRRLEEEIGERLFDRSSKDGTLTAGGEVLLEYAKQMLNLRESAYTAIRELRDLHQGKVSVSANEHTVFYLIPIIQEFRKRHPMIKVEVKRGVASRIPTEVMNREVELGVISFKPEDSSVISIPVKSDELVLIASPNHAFANRQTVSITELGNESFIAHNAVSPYRDQVIKAFEKYKTPLNISVELPSLEAIKKLVEIGPGLALVPKLTAETELRNGTLIGLSVKEMKLERSLHIIYRRNSELSNASKIFVELAKEISKT